MYKYILLSNAFFLRFSGRILKSRTNFTYLVGLSAEELFEKKVSEKLIYFLEAGQLVDLKDI